MTSEFYIRHAELDDALQILTFTKNAFEEPGILLNTGADEFNATEADERRFIEKLTYDQNSLFLVALNDGEVIGTLTCLGGNRRVNRHDTQLGIVIHKEWRSRGLGRAMMTRAIEWAQQTGLVERISLNVFDDNAAAIQLYSKLGFKIEGRRVRALFKHGRYYDEIVMGLLLASL